MVEPQIYLIANDNWIELTLRYVVDYKKRRITKDVLFSKMLTRVEESKGAIQLASATYEVTALPNINVSLKSSD
jgi:two-component SAPR family response regulator